MTLPFDHQETILRRLVEGTARATGAEFFRSLVRNLSLALDSAYSFIAEFADSPTRVRTRALWGRGQLLDNIEYDLAGTPCEAVAQGKLCRHPRGVQQAFPEDRLLGEMGVESYVGVPLLDGAGAVLGHMAVLDTRVMDDDARRLSILEIFTARAAAELERLRAEQMLRASEESFERERNRLHQQNLYLQEEIKELEAQVLLAPHAHQTPTGAVERTRRQSGAPVACGAEEALMNDGEPGTGTLAEWQRRHILRTLEACNWVVEGPQGAAKSLGLQPSTLRSRMKKLGIRRATALREAAR